MVYDLHWGNVNWWYDEVGRQNYRDSQIGEKEGRKSVGWKKTVELRITASRMGLCGWLCKLSLFGHMRQMKTVLALTAQLAEMFFLITCSFIIGPIIHIVRIVGISYTFIVADMPSTDLKNPYCHESWQATLLITGYIYIYIWFFFFFLNLWDLRPVW